MKVKMKYYFTKKQRYNLHFIPLYPKRGKITTWALMKIKNVQIVHPQKIKADI